MGVSWMALIVMDWEWRFHDGRSFMLVSRKEDLVDDTQNDDCLFAKLDFIDKYLPNWLVPTQSRTHLNKTNLETGSRFKGESTTGSIGVGGRNTAILLDEFAKFDPPSTGKSRATTLAVASS